MTFSLSTQGLAEASARRPWFTVGVWVVALVLAVVIIASLLDAALTTDDYFTNNPESDQAVAILVDREWDFGATPSEMVIVQSSSLTVDDTEYRQFVGRLHTELAGLFADLPAAVQERNSVAVFNYYQTGDESLVSENRRTTLIPFSWVPDIDRLQKAVDEADKPVSFQVLVTGIESFDRDFEKIAEEDLSIEFIVGIPAAIIIMIVVFGALLVTAVPVVLALVSIVIAVAVSALVGQIWELSFFVTNVIAMIGLAVGVDYSLFIVSRYREERGSGLDKMDAISAAASTAGRAVFFSGMMVVVVLLIGMLIIPYSIFRSVAAGAIFATLAAVLASLTLLPAVFSIMGDKVNALRITLIGFKGGSGRSESGGFWDRVARVVMRRPIVSLFAAAAIMIAAAAPYFDINLGFPSISTFPDDAPSKQGFLVLDAEFSFGLVEPTRVVIDGDVGSQPVKDAIASLQGKLEADDSFSGAEVLFQPEKDLAVITTSLDGDPAASNVVAAMRRLRNDYIPDAFAGVPAQALTQGETAGNVDFFELADSYLPIVVGFVLAVSFVLLTVVFRSLVVPIKAIIMNLLSVGAAYGLMVLVFQHGIGADFFGFQQVDSIAAWVPLYLFSILFGLSMDYHIFLLSRIRERFSQTGDNTESVAYGVRSTGGLITGAALIMIAVFSGFAMGKLVMFQQMGFGLAVAVALDATIVRSVLVPASMKLLGTRNWWLPSALSWLPEIKMEAPEQPQTAQSPASGD